MYTLRALNFFLWQMCIVYFAKKNSNIVIFQKKNYFFPFLIYRNISQLNSASALLLFLLASALLLLRAPALRSYWSSALLLLLQFPGPAQSHISATSGLFFCWGFFLSGSSVLFTTFFAFFTLCRDT